MPARELAACTLWVAAGVVMIFGTLDSVREHHNAITLPWGIFLAIAACVPTGACVMRRVHEESSVDVEQIIEVVDALHHGEQDVRRLR